ncbi:MAG: DUF4102 domain-containing protein, partial [Mesorhizobium sp.]
MTLSDVKCRNARPGPKLRKISDGGGLQLWVQPTGSRLWRLAYRFDGKQKLLALGSYPLLSLAEARQARDEAKRLLMKGIDQSIRAIDAPSVLNVLREVEVRGRHESARRLRSTIGSIFRYAIATARANADPTLALRDALVRPTVTPRAAITDPKEFGAL